MNEDPNVDPNADPNEPVLPKDAGPRAGDDVQVEPSALEAIAPSGTEPDVAEEAAAPPEDLDALVRARSAAMTRRSLVVGAVAAAAGYAGYRWIDRSPSIGRQEKPLREAFQTDAKVARGVFRERGLAPTYHVKDSVDLRFNGPYGLRDELDLNSWRLQMAGVANPDQYPQFQKDITAWNYVTTPRYVGGTPAESDAKGLVRKPDAWAGGGRGERDQF